MDTPVSTGLTWPDLITAISAAVTAVFAWLMWVVVRGQSAILKAQSAVQMRVDRAIVTAEVSSGGAYIRIQPRQRPDGQAVHDVFLGMTISNHGNTMAKLTAIRTDRIWGDVLPATFQYTQPIQYPNYLLLPGAPLTINISFEMPPDCATGIGAGTHHLWFFGHVDYTDVFDVRRRMGWVRQCNRESAMMNDPHGGESRWHRTNIEYVEGYTRDSELTADEQADADQLREILQTPL